MLLAKGVPIVSCNELLFCFPTIGSVSFPLNRPVCAFYTHPGSNGKLAVVGSGAMFSDQYIDKEDNHKIKDVIFEFLTEGKVYKYIQ